MTSIPSKATEHNLPMVRQRDNQIIFDYLKNNLRISVCNNTDSSYGSYEDSGKHYINVTTTVELFLVNPETGKEEKISDSSSNEGFSI